MRLNIEQLSWTKSKCNSWTEVKRVFNVFYWHKDPSAPTRRLPLVKHVGLCEVLQRVVLDQELHLLKERGSGGRRLLPQQQLDGRRGAWHTQLRAVAGAVVTALGVLTVDQAVCGGTWTGAYQRQDTPALSAPRLRVPKNSRAWLLFLP